MVQLNTAEGGMPVFDTVPIHIELVAEDELVLGQDSRRLRKFAKSNYQLRVLPSVHMQQFGFHWTDIDKI